MRNSRRYGALGWEERRYSEASEGKAQVSFHVHFSQVLKLTDGGIVLGDVDLRTVSAHDFNSISKRRPVERRGTEEHSASYPTILTTIRH
jgi:hypothetical protein